MWPDCACAGPCADLGGRPLQDVLVAGYSNGYIHYVTTPEEYAAQQYEGGSTLFGRWELPALQQTVARLAAAMRDGTAVDPGPPTKDLSGRHRKARRRVTRPDVTPRSAGFGDVVMEARDRYVTGERVVVTFIAAHPANDLHRGGTFLRVEQAAGDGWVTVQDDGDWSTRFRWSRGSRSRVTSPGKANDSLGHPGRPARRHLPHHLRG